MVKCYVFNFLFKRNKAILKKKKRLIWESFSCWVRLVFLYLEDSLTKWDDKMDRNKEGVIWRRINSEVWDMGNLRP